MTDPSVRVPSPRFRKTYSQIFTPGVLDSETSAALWPVVHADPDAHAIVTALDGVTASLATLKLEQGHSRTDSEFACRANQFGTGSYSQNSWSRQLRQLSCRSGGAHKRGFSVPAAAAVLAAFVIVVIGTRDSEPAERCCRSTEHTGDVCCRRSGFGVSALTRRIQKPWTTG